MRQPLEEIVARSGSFTEECTQGAPLAKLKQKRVSAFLFRFKERSRGEKECTRTGFEEFVSLGGFSSSPSEVCFMGKPNERSPFSSVSTKRSSRVVQGGGDFFRSVSKECFGGERFPFAVESTMLGRRDGHAFVSRSASAFSRCRQRRDSEEPFRGSQEESSSRCVTLESVPLLSLLRGMNI